MKPKICPNCQEEMTAWRVGDFDGGYYCSCDLTSVELDGRSIGGVSLASVQDDTYSPFDEDANDVSLVPALTESLRLCGVEVPEPPLKESARSEVA